jgi:zinc and cadmium transporter
VRASKIPGQYTASPRGAAGAGPGAQSGTGGGATRGGASATKGGVAAAGDLRQACKTVLIKRPIRGFPFQAVASLQLVILIYIIAATLSGGVLSVLAAAVIAYGLLADMVQRLVSFAAGALLGAAFIDLLPEAFESGLQVRGLFATLLAGLLAFFLLEKFALWRHSHHHEHDGHHHEHGFDADEAGKSGLLILLGDSLHNFSDGILLAAAFIADPKLGAITTLGIIAHEVPQEAGDFIVLLNAGYSKTRALTYNVISSLASVAGGILGYLTLGSVQGAVPYVVVFAASSFVYIAVADLIPWMHRRADTQSSIWQIVMIALGIAVIGGSHYALH